MPPRTSSRAVATALCLALGGTALLTWAFSIFTEDKKKRPGNAPSSAPPLATPEQSGGDSLLGGGSEDGRSTASVRTAEQLAGQGQEGPALVIENKAAVEAKDDTHKYPSYEQFHSQKVSAPTNGDQMEIPITEDTVAAASVNFFQHVPKFEEPYNSSLVKTPIADAISSEQLNAVMREKPRTKGPIEQRVSQLDTKITTYEEKRPETHQLTPEGDEHSANGGIPLSVSSKSLEKAVMYAPSSHKSRSKQGSFNGVDNSINEIDGKVGAVMEMDDTELSYSRSASFSSEHSKVVSRTPPLSRASASGVDNSINEIDVKAGESMEMDDTELSYSRSASFSSEHSKVVSRTPPLPTDGDRAKDRSDSNSTPSDISAVDNSLRVLEEVKPTTDMKLNEGSYTGEVAVGHMTAAQQLPGDQMLANEQNGGAVAEDLLEPSAAELSNAKANRDVNDNVASETDTSDETKSESLPMTIPYDDNAASASKNSRVSEYYTPVRMERELTPDSLTLEISQDSLEHAHSPKSLERSEMRFLIGVDKKICSSPESGTNSPNRCSGSPMMKSDLYVNIVSDEGEGNVSDSPIERSEYYAPPKLERELTPEPITITTDQTDPDSLQRSEMHMRIKGQKTPIVTETATANISLQQLQASEFNPIELTVRADDSLTPVSVGTQEPGSPADVPDSAVSSNTAPEEAGDSNDAPNDTLKDINIDVIVPNISISVEAEPSVGLDTPDVTVSEADESLPDTNEDELIAGSDNSKLDAESDSVSLHVGDETSSISSEGIESSRRQMTETEEVIETSVEETVTMVITGVVSNPGSEDETVLSMQDAVVKGLLDLQSGLYHNSTTGEKMSMIEAMNTGYIKMGPKKIEKSEEKVKSVGIIKIKTTRETTPYVVKAAKDTRNGEMYHVFQATRRKILDPTKGTFTDLQTGSKMLMGDAIDLGLVQVEYDTNASGTIEEEITQTYSVHAVVDQKEKTKVAFHEAVTRGLIDPETGEYIHNIANVHVPVEEAINRGFIKATLAEKEEDISVDDMGSRVAEQGVEAIRKKLIAPLGVLHKMKH